MRISRTIYAALILFSALMGLSAPANAQATGTWVSGVGDDLNPCSRTAPCITFAGAISKTARGGEIRCLDNGGFGALTITKSITVNCEGQLGNPVNNGGNCFIINITDPADTAATVRLNNIGCNGVGNGSRGVLILSAKSVLIDNMTIMNQTTQGIRDERTVSGGQLFVTNTTIYNTTGPGIAAVAAATNTVVLDNVKSLKGTYGLAVGAGNNVVVSNSKFSGNSIDGVEADFGGQIVVNDSTMSHNNGAGVNAFGAIRLTNNTIAFNNNAIAGSGAASYGNNRIFGNVNAGSPLTTAGSISSEFGQQ